MSTRIPVQRVGELRTITFERWAMYGLLLVGTLSAVISFQALRWLAGLIGVSPTLTWLFPVAIDGVAIVASAATIAMHDKQLRLRVYLWSVFSFFLGVSVIGNGLHAIQFAPAGTILSSRPWAIASVASLAPIAVALSVHLYIVLLKHGTGSAQRVPRPEAAPRARTPRTPQAQGHTWESTHIPEPSTPHTPSTPPAPAQEAQEPQEAQEALLPAPAQDEAAARREAAYEIYERTLLTTEQEPTAAALAEILGVTRPSGSKIRSEKLRPRYLEANPDGPAPWLEAPAVDRIHAV